MEYRLSKDQFYENLFVDSGQKFRHITGKRFKLFPFITQPNSIAVLELNRVAGRFLCQIEDKEQVELTVSELETQLREDTDIETGQEALFYEIVRQMFFFEDEQIRPLNLQMLAQVPCKESSERRIADYLVDVLGDKMVLKEHLQKATKMLQSSCNVLERLVLSKIEMRQGIGEKRKPYFRVADSLKGVFEDDFAYILENQNRTKEYLVPLLEFYFFSYTSQTCLQLNRFMDGERNTNLPLYFCLEWEKTSQSRQCFTRGWRQLQATIEKIFAHAVALEILNQTELGSELVDYIKIREMIKEKPDLDKTIADMIDCLTMCYREAITDCVEMEGLTKEDLPGGATASSIQFLFDNIKLQFENTGRERAYSSYANKFKSYCQKFLKNRGRSGSMLNLSEETLIFLTKICIKDQELMRLNDVFQEFTKRGVFLDAISKEYVALYYEKLNLIEKKSDSGDAKYVKRIL